MGAILDRDQGPHAPVPLACAHSHLPEPPMALLLWQDNLNTGIQVIDDQHRRIVEILYNAKHGSIDILSFWHKLFPR